MEINTSQAPMAAATVNAAKRAFRKVVKEALKGVEGGEVGRQCKLFRICLIGSGEDLLGYMIEL